MGVRNLWPLLASTARPINVSTLDGRRIAVDASIWIYHFLKAVRDGSGNALAYSHVVGFFRRICKLIFLGIKPVFVFDGIAPELKRMTIARRKSRREGMRDNAKRTAEKLLSVQLQRYANREMNKSKSPSSKVSGGLTKRDSGLPAHIEGDRISSHSKLTLSEENFRRSDPYNLPDINGPNGEIKVAHDDERVMTHAEMSDYAELFQPITVSSTGSITTTDPENMAMDFNSEEFYGLPLATQYELLNTARFKSRLRMGYTKDQLEQLFPNRLEFSKFQIQRVVQRNYFTEKIMKFSDGSVPNEGELSSSSSSSVKNATYNAKRIAGERGGEYVLEKNEKGWTLALKGMRNEDNKELDTVVTLDEYGNETRTKYVNKGEAADDDDDDDDEDMDWEDVPLEKKPRVIDNGPFEIDSGDEDKELPESLRSVESILQRDRIYGQQLKQGLDKDDVDLQQAIAMSLEPTKPKTSQPFTLESDDDEEELSTKEKDTMKVDLNEGITETVKVVLPPWFIQKPEGEDKVMESREPSTRQEDIDEDILQDEAAGLIGPTRLNQMMREGLFSDMMHEEKSDRDVIVLDDEDEDLIVLDKEGGDVEPIAEVIGEPTEAELTAEATEATKAIKATEATEVIKATEATEATEATTTPSLLQPPIILTKEEENLAEADEEFAKLEQQEFLKQFETESAEFLRFTQSVNEDNATSGQNATNYNHNRNAKMTTSFSTMMMTNDPLQNTTTSNLPPISSHGRTFTSKTEEQMQREIEELLRQQSKEKRDSDEVSEQMTQEVQTLLKFFGIPFITAPTEAEAQCAKLVQLGLVDGIITDDSDCFLFGGTKVYKNFFNQNKYVECYQLEDIDRELALDRKRLVEMALVLGSDYTDGLPGVGPVTAMELLAEFRADSSADGGDGDQTHGEELENFKQWYQRYQSGEMTEEVQGPGFKRKFGKQFGQKLFLPPGFPDRRVIDAYWNPVVDEDETRFQWGAIDMDGIREYLVDLIGWERGKIDEVLVPVIREINQRERLGHRRQRGLDEWVIPMGNDNGKASKRLKGAVNRLKK